MGLKVRCVGSFLEDGTAIRFPKQEAERLKPLARAGDKFAARGNTLASAFGTVLEAQEIGSSLKTLRPVEPMHPKHEKPGKPHRKHDHPADKH